MTRHPPSSTLTDTLFPNTTLFRSEAAIALFDEIFEDRPRLRDDAVVGIGIDDHRRLAERVNAGERRRSEHRLRIAFVAADLIRQIEFRSEEHTSELQSLIRISYAVFCLKQQTNKSYKLYH